MSLRSVLLATAVCSAGVYSQQAGSLTAETHPKLPVSQCTTEGCTTLNTEITLDANWRWTHSVSGSTNCYTGNTWNTNICSSPTFCAQQCALDGADYAGTYGISAAQDALTLTFVKGSNVGSRSYLMAPGGSKYQMFDLRNKEFTFTVDDSKLVCGLNGALYFVEMAADGGMATAPDNKAGAKFGTGYCDSQCPKDIKFIEGQANTVDWTPSSNSVNTGTGSRGACCAEMDIWEANKISAAFTPHPCSSTGLKVCNTDATCGAGSFRQNGICDRDGCDFNSYRMGNESFYGPGMTIDTASPITVVTQFITADGTDSGTLSEIRRIYIQNGVEIQNSMSDVAGVDDANSITDGFCSQQKTAFGDTNTFGARGGLAAIGQAFSRGMVLVLSLWDDYDVNMLWLDSTYPVGSSGPGVKRGTCGTDTGVPATVEKESGGATVVFSAIKFGALNSTF